MAGELTIKEQHSYDVVERMADSMAKSNLFGMKTKEQFLALMLISQAEGRHPAQVALEYDIIQGRPALRSQAALIRFQASGGKVEYITRSDKEVKAKFSHPQGSTVVVTWDMARAKAMGFDGKDNWRKQPMIMLQWRCIAEGVRACFPACLSGQYLEEEVRDEIPEPRATRPLLDPAMLVKEAKKPQEKAQDAQTVAEACEAPPPATNERLEAALASPVAEEYLKSIKWWPLSDVTKAKIIANLDAFEKAMMAFADKKAGAK